MMDILRILPRLDLIDLRERARLAEKACSGPPLNAGESARLRQLDERWGDDKAGAGGYGVRWLLPAVVLLFVLGALFA